MVYWQIRLLAFYGVGKIVPGIFSNVAMYVCVVACSVGVLGLWVFLIQWRYKKNPARLALQAYIDELVENVPELNILRMKKVKLLVSGMNGYQGSAVPSRYILISKAWIDEACVSSKWLEFVKCTICHELYHLIKHRVYSFSNFGYLFRVGAGRDRAYVELWMEELEADQAGCRWYGEKSTFLEKMDMMDRMSKAKKRRRSTHPSWKVRKEFVKEDIEPSFDVVKDKYEEYYLRRGRA